MENSGIVLGESFKTALLSSIKDEQELFQETLSKFSKAWNKMPPEIREWGLSDFFKLNVSKDEIQRFNKEISQVAESERDAFL